MARWHERTTCAVLAVAAATRTTGCWGFVVQGPVAHQQHPSPALVLDGINAPVCRRPQSLALSAADRSNAEAYVERQVATTALIGALLMAPLAAVPEPVIAASAPPKEAVAPAKAADVVPSEKKSLDAAQAALKFETQRLTELQKDLETTKVESGLASRTARKKEQASGKLQKAIDAELAKLDTIKKSGDKKSILAQKARVADAKQALLDNQAEFRSYSNTAAKLTAKADGLTSSIKQTEKAKKKAKSDIEKYDKKYKQYLDNAAKKKKELAEKKAKDAELAKKKAEEAKKKAAEQARKKLAAEKKAAEKQAAERQAAMKKKAEEVKAKAEAERKAADAARVKAEAERKQALKDQVYKAKEARKKQEEARKVAEEKKQALVKKQREQVEAEKAAAKKAAEEKAKKVAVLKTKLQQLQSQKGDLIVKDAPQKKIDALEAKIDAVNAEIQQLVPSGKTQRLR